VASTSVQTVTKVITPKKNTLTTSLNRIPLLVFVDLSFGRYDGPGTTHVIFVLYLYDATFIFQ
jgi:hypothetical protein